METKQNLLLKDIEAWIHDYEKDTIHNTDLCIALKDDAYNLFLDIKDSIEMGEL